jgi:signal transduction histidine kinase
MALYIARSAALIAVAAGIGWLGLRARRTRALVARLGREHSVGLRDVLARALGDPGVRVAFAHAGGWVDATGAPVALDGGVTRIERGGEPVAVVMHDASPLDAAALAREIGAAARLSVDNERLEAEVRAQVAGLRSSRAEIVETGDAARRTLERDLHDGAQQQLLALLYELRLAGLPEAAAEAQAALEDLRRLAHGIYPAILGEAGLRAALQSAAEESDIPVELGRIEPGRLSAAVETAAYLVAVAGIEASTTHAVIDASRRDGVLVVSVMGDVHEAPGQLADRVGALGGTLRAIEGTLEAAIPCA